MPLALALFGVLLIVVGARGTYPDLQKLLKEDFTGQGNFFMWLLAVGVVGSIGYVPTLQQFSRIFLGLVLLVYLIKNMDFPNKLIQAIQSVSGDTGQGQQSTGGAGGGSVAPNAAQAAGAQ